MGRKSGKMLRIGSVQRQKRSSSDKDMIILVLRTVSRWVGVSEGMLKCSLEDVSSTSIPT